MSAAQKVDVLALLDALELQTRQRGGSPSCKNIADARTAIAELIDASNKTIHAFEVLGQISGLVDTHIARAECERAMLAQKEALARIGGKP